MSKFNLTAFSNKRDYENAAFQYMPQDFYVWDESGENGLNAYLNEYEINDALKVASKLQSTGSYKAAQILVCKIASAYREYEQKIKKYREEQNNG